MPTLTLAPILVACSAALAAQPEAAPAPPPPPPPPPSAIAAPAADASPTIDLAAGPAWTIRLEPAVWYVSPSGDLKLPVASGSGAGGFTTEGDDVPIQRLNLDTPRLSPAGEVHLSAGKLRFTFSGAAYSIDRDATPADSTFRIGGVAVEPGDRLDVGFDLATVELTGGYQIYYRDFAATSADPAAATPIDLRVHAIGGARFYDFSAEVRNLDSDRDAGSDQFFGEPIIGLRAETEIARRFTIDLQSTVGYYADSDKDVFSIDIAVGFTWRPAENVGVQLGYRQLAYWLSDGAGGSELDEFEYTGRLAGLFAGLEIRF